MPPQFKLLLGKIGLMSLILLGGYLLFVGVLTGPPHGTPAPWIAADEESGMRPLAYTPVSWSDMLHRIDRKEFEKARVSVDRGTLVAVTKGAENAYVTALPPGDRTTFERLEAAGVDVEILPASVPSASLLSSPLFLTLLSTGLIVLVILYLGRRAGGGVGPGSVLGMSKTRARAVDPGSNPTRLADVAGCDEAKREVAEIVEFLKRPDDYVRVGARGPQGVLMSGPPGTGKTLLAKAIAGEAGVPFFSTSGSDFVEMFVGVGAARVRDMFAQAKAHAPSIVFIDEIDAIGRSRGSGMQQGHDEREQTLNALLVEMDGFSSNSGVVIIAATNRPEILDAALRRPGRFDREVTVALPDRAGRARILALHASRVPVDPAVDWDTVARGTPGFSGADLANVINEAAIGAARERRNVVTAGDLDEARDKVTMGAARQGGLTNATERKIVAYHEAGHAVVAHFDPHADPVHKVTILPRGQALGVTMQLPQEDIQNHDRSRLQTMIRVLLGGRAAEDVALNTATVGAANDFERASHLARNMVARWGMSPLGTMVVNADSGIQGTQWSHHWLQKVDDAVAALLAESYTAACAVLTRNRAALDAVAHALLEHETLDAEAFGRLVTAHTPEFPGQQEPAASEQDGAHDAGSNRELTTRQHLS